MKTIRSAVIAIFLLCFSSFANAHSVKRPPAPQGMEWYKTQNDIGTFLRPKGWFVKEEIRGGTSAFFISKENIDKHKTFLTGLTVNKIKWTEAKSKSSASQDAEAYIKKIARDNRHTTLIKPQIVQSGSTTMHLVRVMGNDTIVHHIAIGSEEALYLVIAEAPKSQWNVQYKYFRPMLNIFILNF